MRKKSLISVSIIIFAFIAVILSINDTNRTVESKETAHGILAYPIQVHSVKSDYIKSTKKNEEKSSEVSLISVGDVLFHMPEVEAAKENGSYNFKPMFSEIKDVLDTKDIAVANFESTINPNQKLSGYPTFNTPVQALDALKDTGIDVLLSDNNHSLDTGMDGIKTTTKFIKQYGFKVVGSGNPGEDKSAIVEKNGIKIGMLSYTYGTNFGVKYKDMINYIDENAIRRDMTDIRKKCDFVIVYLHVGTEYVRSVEPFQASLIKDIAAMGPDAILCMHPHVARKSEVLSSNGREVFVNYSMGNFISNQNDKYTDIGTMVNMIIMKKGNDTQIKYAETIPVYRLRYTSQGKPVFKTVLSSSIDNYSKLVGSSNVSYVKQVSGELAFKYEPSLAVGAQK